MFFPRSRSMSFSLRENNAVSIPEKNVEAKTNAVRRKMGQSVTIVGSTSLARLFDLVKKDELSSNTP